MTEAEAKALLTAACDFQARSLKGRTACSEEYRSKESNEHNILRILIDGQIASIANRFSNQIVETNERISYQLAIVTSYIRSHFLINDLIMGGDIIEALTVIRRQIEALARLNEADSGPLQMLFGRTPNVKNILNQGSGPLYGYLSEVAHSSSPRLSTLLGIVSDPERIGASLIPVFSESLAAAFEVHWFFALHFLAWVIEKLGLWHREYDNSDDKRLLGEALLLGVQLNVLRNPQAGPETDG